MLAVVIWLATVINTNQIVAVVLPHHNLVRQQRQELLKTVAKKVQPQTIILVSPNHFAAGVGAAITTDRTWSLGGGEYRPNPAVIAALQQAGVVTVEDEPFVREHGIFNVLPDLQTVWPRALVVPIILRENIARPEIEKLLATLQRNCRRCLLVASVDFSHYQPEALADLHDVATQRSLHAADADAIWNAEVDSPAALALMIGWANVHHAPQFTQFNHTNSGTIAENPEVETTTHVFGWYQRGRMQMAPPVKTYLTQAPGLDTRSSRGVDTVVSGVEQLPQPDLHLKEAITSGEVMVGEQVESDQTTIILLPLSTVNGQVQFARGESRRAILQRLIPALGGAVIAADLIRGVFSIKTATNF